MATATIATAHDALEKLSHLETSGKLSILELSSAISGGQPAQNASGARTSDASSYADDEDAATPASLAADLVHYKELFSKLRFSYLEQVTKEKFLRAITAETPLFIEASDNLALEAQLAEEKIALKQQKHEVTQLTHELEVKGRQLATRYQALQEQRETLAMLPEHLETMQARIDELRGSHPSPKKNVNEELNLPLAETLALLAERQAGLAGVDERIKGLQEEIPSRGRELERLNGELALLSQQKKMAVARAKEARERKERGGMDEVERRGRWLTSGELLMKDMFEIES